MQHIGPEQPRRWEWWALWLLIIAAGLFSILVEIRSAFLSRRMGDLGCFQRAHWAVRTGQNIYEVTCDNGWHYNYPPLFAILMTPLADPPPGFDSTGMVPYPVSVAIFYALSIVLLVLAVHWLASALEEAVPGLASVPGSRRWLVLRIFPVWVCLLPIGHSLSRGQVNALWMLLMTGMIAAVLRRKRFTAGVYLAAAICLKIIPGYLLLYPLWRRDGRAPGGSAVGLVIGLGVLPAIVMGPGPAARAYKDLSQVLIGPALGLGDDQSRATELTGITDTNNVSFQAAIHHLSNSGPKVVGQMAAPWVRRAHWAVGGTLTLLTLLAAGRRRPQDPLVDAVFLGSLALLNLLVSPVCHTYYFSLAQALIAALVVVEWRRNDEVGRPTRFAGSSVSGRMWVLAMFFFIFTIVPLLPGAEEYRNTGVAMVGVLALWAEGCLVMCRMRKQTTNAHQVIPSSAAA